MADGETRPRRPDLVLIMTDQQRYDQVGYASGGHFETPHLDALAARGTVLHAAYSASTVCVPARAALLTGVQPHRLPTQENKYALREGFWTVARALRDAGYETALIGKMHFAPVHADHGFETMRLCEHLQDQGLGPLSRERGDIYDDYHAWLVEQGLDDWRLAPGGGLSEPFPYAADLHPTAWVERETLSFLAGRPRGDAARPLFLVVSFPHPHAPYDPPEPYASMYDPADSVLPEVGDEANDGLPMVFRMAVNWSKTRDEAARPHRVRAFLATVRGLVRQIDDAVGAIAQQLDLASTLVFFTSDHGDFSGHRGLMRKDPWVPWDDLARVPMFVAGAGVATGCRAEHVVQNSDFALTCLDWAGVDPPSAVTFDSRSLRPLLEGHPGPDEESRAVYSAISIGWPMVRRGQFKLMTHHAPGRMPVLYDLDADPDETVTRANDPELADVRAELAGLLDAMRTA